MPQRLFILTAILLTGFQPLIAQPLPNYTARQRSQIDAFRRDVQARFADNYDRAVRLANQLGRPLRMAGGPGQSRPGRTIELAGLDDNGQLYYVGANSNTQAGISTRTTSFYAGGSLGLSLNGSSESVRSRLGIWEVQGFPRVSHVEFGGRINHIDGSSTSADDILHSTHVAGTLIAAGRNPSVRGMANGASLQSYNSANDVAEMASASGNLLISNHSYGLIAGWRFNGNRTGTTQWEWYGDTSISQTKEYRFGFYDSRARAWDQIAVNAPSYLIVTAATNNHGQNGPGAGQPHFLGTSNTISTVSRDNQNGYDQIPSYNQAKNVLSVGAVSTLPLGYNQPSDVNLASFSSWGPTDDGRIKPDIVGVGVNVLSTSSSGDSLYATLSGTSMASPNVAGSLLLLQELYAQRNGGQFMRSSTLKGLAIHTADETGSAPGPDYRFGWGLLNMERAGRAMLNTDQNYLVSERTLEQGGTVSVPVVASGRGPLVATICWTDPAGTVSSPTLDDRTPKLVNDLDIRVSDETTTTQPWVLDPANPANAATRGDNIRDNVEQVLIANPVPGRSYTISIAHKGNLTNGPQNYALLVSGIGGQAYCASGAGSNADTRIARVQFGSIDQAGASGCTTYTDFTQVRTNVQPGQALPLTVSLGTCGATRNATIKVFADWNQNGSFDDPGELQATSSVLANNAAFTIPITTPATAQNGQLIRLRIVASETEDPATVNACGTYGNGETQDYVLNVVQVANDVGPTALVSPEPGLCGLINSDLAVTVRVRNYGSANQTNIPVAVRITDSDGRSIAFLNGTLPTLAAFREGVLTLRSSGVTLAAGQVFRFQITTGLANDQIPANSTFVQSLTTTPTPTNGLFSALRCGTDTLVSLRNAGGGTAFWYDAPTGGNLLAAGNQTNGRVAPANGTYFAALNEFSGAFGPADKNAFTGGSYAGNFGPAPLITTTVPLTIERARLYISAAGQLTFTVRRFDDTPISSVTLDVLPTRNTSLTATNSGGMLLDDPNDPGAEYTLNLRIPTPGDYKITIAYANGAGIFRSNAGVTGFPYRLTAQNGQAIVSSRGALFNNANGGVDTLTTAWYYLYNIRVRSLDCPTLTRTPVTPASGTATTATITPNGSASVCAGGSLRLQATTGPGLTYQWFRNGTRVTGATSSTLQASTAGDYVVQVANGCPAVQSAPVTVAIRSAQSPVAVANGLVLTSDALSNIQWFRDGVAIPGATASSYTAVQSGRYSVRGNVNGCGESLSNDLFITITASEPDPQEAELVVFPNPTSRLLTVRLTGVAARTDVPTVRLIDQRGSTLLRADLQRDGKSYSTVLDISTLPGGTFFVVINEARTATVRLKRIRKL